MTDGPCPLSSLAVQPVADASESPRQPESDDTDDRLAGDSPDIPRACAYRAIAASNSELWFRTLSSTGASVRLASADPVVEIHTVPKDTTAAATRAVFRTDLRIRRLGLEAFDVVMGWLLVPAVGLVPTG